MFRGVKASLPKLIGSTPKLTPLVYKSEFYVRVRPPSTINSEFSKERADYRKLLKEYRLKNIKAYWERQTQVENEYIEKWNKLQQEKYQRDLIHLRHNVVKISAGTQRHIEERLKNEGKKLKNLEKHMLEEQNKKANRQHILKMLNFDSKTWFTLQNIEEKMVANVLIPDFVYDQTSYYLKLQEQAILHERADYEGLEESMSEINLIKEKNIKLMPIYEELVNLIKHITYDEETKYLEEYTHLKSVITNSDDLRPLEKEEKINKLKKSYALLVEKWREESDTTPKKVQNLYKQLIFLYNLLRIWETYIRLVKMDGYQFRMMMEGEEEEAESAIHNLDDVEDLKEVDPLKAETLSDAMTSANERATSDSDEEFTASPLEEGVKTPKHVKDLFNEKPMTPEQVQAQKTEDLFHSILGKSTEELEKEFDEQFARATDKDRFLYGGRSDKRATEAAEFLKKNSIESFIPEQEIQGARNFEDVRLDYLNADQIENEEDYMPEGENPNKLNTSAMVEAYKRELEDLESREKLSRKEKNKLKDIRKLLDRIGEIRVEEGKLLLKVFDTFKPKYSLD